MKREEKSWPRPKREVEGEIRSEGPAGRSSGQQWQWAASRPGISSQPLARCVVRTHADALHALSSGLALPPCLPFLIWSKARPGPAVPRPPSPIELALHCIALHCACASAPSHDDGLRRLRHRRRYLATTPLSSIPSPSFPLHDAWHAASFRQNLMQYIS